MFSGLGAPRANSTIERECKAIFPAYASACDVWAGRIGNADFILSRSPGDRSAVASAANLASEARSAALQLPNHQIKTEMLQSADWLMQRVRDALVKIDSSAQTNQQVFTPQGPDESGDPAIIEKMRAILVQAKRIAPQGESVASQLEDLRREVRRLEQQVVGSSGRAQAMAIVRDMPVVQRSWGDAFTDYGTAVKTTAGERLDQGGELLGKWTWGALPLKYKVVAVVVGGLVVLTLLRPYVSILGAFRSNPRR